MYWLKEVFEKYFVVSSVFEQKIAFVKDGLLFARVV